MPMFWANLLWSYVVQWGQTENILKKLFTLLAWWTHCGGLDDSMCTSSKTDAGNKKINEKTNLSAWCLTFQRGIRCPGPGIGMMNIFKAKITHKPELTLRPTSLLNLAADCKQELTRKPLSLPQCSFVYSGTVGVKNVFTGPRQLSHTPCLSLRRCAYCFCTRALTENAKGEALGVPGNACY